MVGILMFVVAASMMAVNVPGAMRHNSGSIIAAIICGAIAIANLILGLKTF